MKLGEFLGSIIGLLVLGTLVGVGLGMFWPALVPVGRALTIGTTIGVLCGALWPRKWTRSSWLTKSAIQDAVRYTVGLTFAAAMFGAAFFVILPAFMTYGPGYTSDGQPLASGARDLQRSLLQMEQLESAYALPLLLAITGALMAWVAFLFCAVKRFGVLRNRLALVPPQKDSGSGSIL